VELHIFQYGRAAHERPVASDWLAHKKARCNMRCSGLFCGLASLLDYFQRGAEGDVFTGKFLVHFFAQGRSKVLLVGLKLL
jgi:hypothetical protein